MSVFPNTPDVIHCKIRFDRWLDSASIWFQRCYRERRTEIDLLTIVKAPKASAILAPIESTAYPMPANRVLNKPIPFRDESPDIIGDFLGIFQQRSIFQTGHQRI